MLNGFDIRKGITIFAAEIFIDKGGQSPSNGLYSASDCLLANLNIQGI